MKIYTLNVGQGQFSIVVGNKEAVIVDTFVPLSPTQPIIHVKSALTDILSGKNLIGLIVTGFDADHFNEVGMKIVLNKYRPNWIMYPKYFKKTQTADACFNVIEQFEVQKKFNRISILLGDNNRRLYDDISENFSFEIFSPHKEDMDSSNNCSLVCKIEEKITGVSYLVTGDTENNRWESITRIFGKAIKSDVLDAPHHGSKNGITTAAIQNIAPHTVLISAGVDNSYSHPHQEALNIFKNMADNVYSTNNGNGQSLLTKVTPTTIETTLYTTKS